MLSIDAPELTEMEELSPPSSALSSVSSLSGITLFIFMMNFLFDVCMRYWRTLFVSPGAYRINFKMKKELSTVKYIALYKIN